MFRRISSIISALLLLAVFSMTQVSAKEADAARVRVPVNIAILIGNFPFDSG